MTRLGACGHSAALSSRACWRSRCLVQKRSRGLDSPGLPRNSSPRLCLVHLRVRIRTQHIYQLKILLNMRNIFILCFLLISFICFYTEYQYNLIISVGTITDIFFVYLIICDIISEPQLYLYGYMSYFI